MFVLAGHISSNYFAFENKTIREKKPRPGTLKGMVVERRRLATPAKHGVGLNECSHRTVVEVTEEKKNLPAKVIRAERLKQIIMEIRKLHYTFH